MADLLALAERCEAATGPSYALELDIMRAVNPQATRLSKPAPYTASLDAAMTLVPEAWRLRQMNFSAPCADDKKWHLNLHGGREGGDTFVGRGQAAALALCAAALRAREQS